MYEKYKTFLINANISKIEFEELEKTLKKLDVDITTIIKDNRPMLNKNDIFIESYEGHEWGSEIKNSYDIFEDTNSSKYVRMYVGSSKFVFFDLDDYNKLAFKKDDTLKNKKVSWFIGHNGYVAGKWDGNKNNVYMHHIVMSFKGTGRGFQEISVDHIDRNPLNNRKSNLRLATVKEQQENTKGSIEGTKRERKHNAKPLPEGISELPKYVVYYKEKLPNNNFREFFRIEKHPIIKNKWATSKSNKICIKDKLEEAVKMLEAKKI